MRLFAGPPLLVIDEFGYLPLPGEAASALFQVVHRSVVLNLDGDSYRLRDHHAKNDVLRATATGTRRPLQ